MISYKKAGVDSALSDKFTEFLEKKSSLIGGFAGLYSLKKYGSDYSLVACTDGVGTKLKLAFALNRHDSIGIDLVAMCVNDLITCGGEPLFFLDYYATGKLDLKKSKSIIKGILKGCEMSGMILLGGETAEMPGFYSQGEYDLGGFSVGIVKNSEIINGAEIKEGDCVIGFKSSGFHSNGYSLIRKIMDKKPKLKKYSSQFLTPTKIYVKQIKKIKSVLARKGSKILGLAHITGSGIEGNLERIIPSGFCAYVDSKKWEIPYLMRLLAEEGKISQKEMFSTFNMGIGMIAVVSQKDEKEVLKADPSALPIGKIGKGEKKVKICGI
ncbi:MAG: phosphoribosylformylglycinamidine cyclo-ligase [Elusimicrobia bacterium]|nr:phosphoribosylformylglycinamidine cyclo-ligase [Elusimicrobiota bacterium]